MTGHEVRLMKKELAWGMSTIFPSPTEINKVSTDAVGQK